MMKNWSIVTLLLAAHFTLSTGMALAGGQYGPGVSDTEIKIGNTMPYSGPASSYGAEDENMLLGDCSRSATPFNLHCCYKMRRGKALHQECWRRAQVG